MLIKKEFVRFIFVGILNTIVGYLLYAFFLYLGFDYKIAALLATILGVLFNFQTIGRLVFKQHDNTLILRFISVYVIVYFIGIALIKLGKICGLDDYTAGFVALFPNAALSFLLNKFYVYRTK